MQEIELKLQVDPARRAAVASEVAGRTPARRLHLQASYFDTADRALAQARLALRVRREGRHWVQTLKGATDDGLTRAEHNVPLEAGAVEAPMADPSLHAETEVGRRLLGVIGSAWAPALQCLYRTDVWRRTRRLRTRLGHVELAFDEGRIVAGDRQRRLSELEIELLGGSPLAVLETARRWVARHGVTLDTRSKSELGDLLARGETMAPERHAGEVRLCASMSVGQAWSAVLRSCLDQVSVNASQLASGEYRDEHVHQLRVGLRRLRTALRLFDVDPALPLVEQAARVFRALGQSRDVAALKPLEAELGEAIEAVRAGLRAAGIEGSGEAPDPVDVVRDPATQTLLLDLLVAAQVPPLTEDGADLTLMMAARLNRWHRRAVSDARRFMTLDDVARHRLRKRAKRLRYAIEFTGELFERKGVKRYLKTLRRLQERLGALNDVTTALDFFRRRAVEHTSSAFAMGWLAARREALIRACGPELEDFVEADRFWKS
jgi:inorganic triphosphatase YgiF